MGAKAVRGSEAARRIAALMLEAWSGVRSTQSASEAMGVALTRFYQLEARALQLIVSAMEPRPRGRQLTPESELGKLRAEKQRLVRDAERYQSLYRTAQRALGIAVANPPAKDDNPAAGGKRKRGPRKRARGQAVAAVLLGGVVAGGAGREATDGATEQRSEPRGRDPRHTREQTSSEDHPEDDHRRVVRERGV
ncbi:MAG TPA: hypothetical protein VF384_20385 [Planctomycetota bacterium]